MDVFAYRSWRSSKETEERRIDDIRLTKAQAEMERGLNERLPNGHAGFNQMSHIADDAGRTIGDRSTKLC